MTGLNGQRVYLDWNATAPLRPEARAAMLDAMDVVGNPSSVHAEGRAAKSIVETARAQVGRLVGCDPADVVFTSGATEAFATVAFDGTHVPRSFSGTDAEHDAVAVHVALRDWQVGQQGQIEFQRDGNRVVETVLDDEFALGVANSETGVIQPYERFVSEVRDHAYAGASATIALDLTQAVGKIPMSFETTGADFGVCSAHKFGGPKGVGAIVLGRGRSISETMIKGGGQEQGRRSGTENVIGIAGFGAAAEAALRDLEAGAWGAVEKLRNILETRLANAAPKTIFFGQDSPRLPNTSCFAVPGWKGETQVMQMDLSGFAVSAGSACSSGKVNKASRVLLAMGFDEETASSAIRVSMGPTTTEAEVMAFADSWIEAYRRREARAA